MKNNAHNCFQVWTTLLGPWTANQSPSWTSCPISGPPCRYTSFDLWAKCKLCLWVYNRGKLIIFLCLYIAVGSSFRCSFRCLWQYNWFRAHSWPILHCCHYYFTESARSDGLFRSQQVLWHLQGIPTCTNSMTLCCYWRSIVWNSSSLSCQMTAGGSSFRIPAAVPALVPRQSCPSSPSLLQHPIPGSPALSYAKARDLSSAPGSPLFHFLSPSHPPLHSSPGRATDISLSNVHVPLEAIRPSEDRECAWLVPKIMK